MQDGLHHGALRAFAHVEDGGDDPCADLLEVALRDASVNAVSEHPVEVIDDDVVDVLLGLDPGDHLLEGRAFVDAGGCPARLNELPHNVRAELLGFLLPCKALSRDRYAFRVVVSIDLAWRGHA
nr:hypothetical protein [Amycolatopsis dendrobii]